MSNKTYVANTIPLLIENNPKLKLFVHSAQSLEDTTNPKLVLDLKIPNTKFYLKIIRNSKSKDHWKIILTDTNISKQIIGKITTVKLLKLLDNLVERIENNNKKEPYFYRDINKCAQLIINIINSKVYNKKIVKLNYTNL